MSLEIFATQPEYRQRLQPHEMPNEHEGLEIQMGKLRRGIARLIDSYADGLIDKQEFEPRVTRMRERLQHLEEQLQRLKEESEVEEELRLILGRLETFAAKVRDGLQHADFQTRRDIIRVLVKRVEVDEQHIRIVFRVSPTSLPPSSQDASPNWQHWGRREDAGAFHGHVADALSGQPVGQLLQAGGGGGEGTDGFAHFAGGSRQQHTSHDGLLVNIQAGAAGIEKGKSHCQSPFRSAILARDDAAAATRGA